MEVFKSVKLASKFKASQPRSGTRKVSLRTIEEIVKGPRFSFPSYRLKYLHKEHLNDRYTFLFRIICFV